MKDKDIDIAAVYKLVLRQSERIIDNQHTIIGKLDELIRQGGEQQAMELQSLHELLRKTNADNRQLEYENFFMKLKRNNKMSKTSIAWTERTWNPVTGCTKISEGCRHCYAETMAKSLQGMGQKRYANGFELTLHPEALNEPKKVKEPSMFFVCSMADLFHKDVPFEFVDEVMKVIEATPQHKYQLLTKRAILMHQYLICLPRKSLESCMQFIE